MRDYNIPVKMALNRVLDTNISPIKHFCESAGEGSTTDVDELRKNFRAVQEENNKLQAVITDVTEVNKQWQKYNNDRQLYVQCLLSTIQDQQEKINKTVEKRATPFPTVSQAMPEDDKVKLENAQLREEVAMLRQQLEQKERQYQEHVEVLEFQVKAHRDDWEAERSEKQQALKHKEAMEQHVKELEKHVLNLKLKLREQHCELCCGCEQDDKHCSRHHPKTYRTSVHLPCTSGRLKSQESTCCNKVVVDDQNADKLESSDNKIMRSKSCSMEEAPDDEHRYSCSVLHISPTASGSSISGDGVTIGFNSSGLASVTTFSERPVVKSSSMPISDTDADTSFKSTFSQWSSWASIARPPVSEEKSLLAMKSRSSSNSESNVTVTNIRKTSVPWKAKYFEEGVATQTKEDVICPGCGQIFPPNLQIEFLDHFEVCQKCEKKKLNKPRN